MEKELMARMLGIALGIGVHVVFAATVVQLYRFLDGTRPFGTPGSMWWDVALALQFVVPHSWLLHPRTRDAMRRWIPSAFYGLFFCAATCGSLGIAFGFWRSSDWVLLECQGVAAWLMRVGFWCSWGALFYSLSLGGLGYQTGWTPWWYWLRRVPSPRRAFREVGAYRVLRHPIYLSFAGLLWFSPTVTLDRAILMGIWTIYIAVGSVLKDRRLAYYLGQSYTEYAQRVPGYPGIPWGPLARLRLVEGAEVVTAQAATRQGTPRKTNHERQAA